MPKTKLDPLAASKAVNIAHLVSRLRTLYPILRAMATDSVLRQLLLSELILQYFWEDGAVVLPCTLRVHAVEEDRFLEFKNYLSGLTADNIMAVQQKLVEMGLSLGPAAEMQLAVQVATSTAAAAVVQPAAQPAASVVWTGHTVAQQVAAGALRMEDAAMSRMHTLLGVVQSGTV